ncbi:MAG: DUF484 family protein, partial [Pseudomonadota bacterium]
MGGEGAPLQTPGAALKAEILKDPALVLEDRDVMRALLDAGGGLGDGRKVVDLRGKLVDRLEDRLDRLEETHRTVVAAAYENLAGTQQIHRAVLALLEAPNFREFLNVLNQDVANILALDMIRLGLEATSAPPGADLGPSGPMASIVKALPKGAIDDYVAREANAMARKVTLRPVRMALPELYDAKPLWLQSEALIRLDLGAGKLPGLLALGSEDAQRFDPDQGTDLLQFFGA